MRMCPHRIGEQVDFTTTDNPNVIWPQTTWTAVEGSFPLASNSSHSLGSTGGSETVTLTTAQMPSHTHTVGAHKHTVPEHGHGFTQPTVNGGATTTGNGGSHRHNFQANYARAGWSGLSPGGYVTTEKTSVFGSQYSWKENVKTNTDDGTEIVKSGGDHNHSQVAHTHSVSGGAVSNHAAFDTSNSTAFNSGSNGSDGAHNNMPPFVTVNRWKRVA